jgi:hypothetical protein
LGFLADAISVPFKTTDLVSSTRLQDVSGESPPDYVVHILSNQDNNKDVVGKPSRDIYRRVSAGDFAYQTQYNSNAAEVVQNCSAGLVHACIVNQDSGTTSLDGQTRGCL